MKTRLGFVFNCERSQLVLLTALFFCISGLPGCGAKSAPAIKLAPVKGIVLFREKPLANARLNFFSQGVTVPLFCETNEAGEFELKGGAAVGVNKITVVLQDSGSASTFMPDPTKLGAAPTAGPTNAERPKQSSGVELPQIYGDAINSPLSLTLKPEGDMNVKLELK